MYHIPIHMFIQGYEESDLNKFLLYGQIDYSGIKIIPLLIGKKKKKKELESSVHFIKSHSNRVAGY